MWKNKNTSAAMTYSGLAMAIDSASAENSGLQGRNFDFNAQYWCEVCTLYFFSGIYIRFNCKISQPRCIRSASCPTTYCSSNVI